MTENSDAVVLVVSEETGIISIVSNGKITRNYNSMSAAEELRHLLVNDDEIADDNKIITLLKRFNPFKKENGKDAEKADETEN